MPTYDLIVIGAGPGGYVCAIRAAQLGLKVACVEGRETLGGTCLNVGCIPSKALLHASHMLHETHENFEKMGLMGAKPKVDWAKMQGYKAETVGGNTKGIEFLFKKNKIDWLKGWASIEAPGKVKVGDQIHETKNIVIASGSEPASLKGVEVNNDAGIVVDSTGALSLPKIPKSMVVIGAGVIGLELGSVWKRLGSDVTVLEALPDFLAVADAEVAKTAAREFKKQGLDIRLGAKVSKTEITGKGKKKEVVVTYTDKNGEQTITFDKLLVSVGRKAASKGLLAEGTGVKLDPRGVIEVDEHCHTGVDGVWAVGDCVRGPMLAHKGFEEGIAVAELIAGLPGHVNYDTIPNVIYTEPEIAWVGKTEQQLKEDGTPYKTGSFPFAALGRAVAMAEPAGFVKVIAHAETDRVLGLHLVGVGVSELVHEGVLAMEFKGSADDLARICHAHPTLSESIHDAAMAVDKRAIHKAN